MKMFEGRCTLGCYNAELEETELLIFASLFDLKIVEPFLKNLD